MHVNIRRTEVLHSFSWWPSFHLLHLCKFLISRWYQQKLDNLQTATVDASGWSCSPDHPWHLPPDASQVISTWLTSVVWQLLLMCWTHLCVALVCDGATLPEAGRSTSTKSRAWWISYSFSVNSSFPQSPFHPSNLGEVSFLSKPVETIAGPPEAKPCQHQLKNSPHLPAIPQEIRSNIRKSSSRGLLAWAVQRVAPKEFLSSYPVSFLTRKLLTYCFSTWQYKSPSLHPQVPIVPP